MYAVIVYNGKSHWNKPIDEISLVFETMEEAKTYADSIEIYRPEYYIEIVKD